MKQEILLPIETVNPLFGRYLYPTAKEIMEQQQDVTWTAQEIPVEKDKHDYLTKMSKEQTNLIEVTLQMFVEIEQEVGDIWGIIASWFPHSEIEGCAIEISRMEKAVHAFFYQKMSDVLNIEPETIAKNQEAISVLRSKLYFLKRVMQNVNQNKPLTLATVAGIEQVFLFSNFAMLKSFKSNGNNLIKNTLTGVDFVVQDEQLHGEFAAYLFHVYKAELLQANPSYDVDKLEQDIRYMLAEILQHEFAVISYTFPGEAAINDITGHQLKQFVTSRANNVLELLGYEPTYNVEENPIADWFYQGVKSIKSHDFFAANTNQYRRSWKYDNFSLGAVNE